MRDARLTHVGRYPSNSTIIADREGSRTHSEDYPNPLDCRSSDLENDESTDESQKSRDTSSDPVTSKRDASKDLRTEETVECYQDASDHSGTSSPLLEVDILGLVDETSEVSYRLATSQSGDTILDHDGNEVEKGNNEDEVIATDCDPDADKDTEDSDSSVLSSEKRHPYSVRFNVFPDLFQTRKSRTSTPGFRACI